MPFAIAFMVLLIAWVLNRSRTNHYDANGNLTGYSEEGTPININWRAVGKWALVVTATIVTLFILLCIISASWPQALEGHL
jgi:hypothetical protein